MLNIKKSILRTLVYSDIFDYPLTSDEIWKYLINKERISKKEFFKNLKNLPSVISKKDKFYFLKNRDSIIQKRIEREKESEIKFKIAKKVSSRLSKIPTILLIGVSGTVAMKNADKEEDIDLFIITKKNTLWITRLFILFVLEILGKRRRRKNRNVSNKICVNLLIDETAIYFEKDRKDLYTSHEIVQMKPVFERKDMYKKFIISNLWIKKFLPNAFESRNKLIINSKKKSNIFVLKFFEKINNFAKKVQLMLIKKHKTTEIVSNSFVAFHPFDARGKVLIKYRKILSKYV